MISLNRPPVNGLSVDLRRAVLNNVDRAMKENMKAIVLAGEGSMFSGGADIKEIARGAYFKSPTLTELTDVLDSCNIPVISGIHGYALGGAMEIGLASHYRVATKTAKIGFPEVNLGLLSGSGGTQRLTRLLGAKHALDLLTTGKLIGAMEAAKLGIVDNVLSHGASFHDELADFALSDRVQNTPLSERRLSMRMVPGTTTDEGGVLVVDKEHWANILEVTTANARGQIAPLAILKCVQAAMATQTQGFEVGQSVEEQLLQVLMKGPQATALQYLFLSEKKCSTVPKDSDLRTQHVPLPDGKDKKTVAITEVKSVGVVGGGTMGAGIVMSCIGAGIPVVLVETSTELAAAALLRIERIYQSSSAYRTGRMSKADLKERLNLITVTRFFERLADVDLVIEAVPESLKLKQEVFAQLDKMCKSSAILATNTSYLDIDQIGSVTSRPHNVVGTRKWLVNMMLLFERTHCCNALIKPYMWAFVLWLNCVLVYYVA